MRFSATLPRFVNDDDDDDDDEDDGDGDGDDLRNDISQSWHLLMSGLGPNTDE